MAATRHTYRQHPAAGGSVVNWAAALVAAALVDAYGREWTASAGATFTVGTAGARDIGASSLAGTGPSAAERNGVGVDEARESDAGVGQKADEYTAGGHGELLRRGVEGSMIVIAGVLTCWRG